MIVAGLFVMYYVKTSGFPTLPPIVSIWKQINISILPWRLQEIPKMTAKEIFTRQMLKYFP